MKIRSYPESIYNELNENGKILSKDIDQFFDESKQMFLPDRFIKGVCPKCKAEDQYGDSCEKCGATYSPTDLINAYSVHFRVQNLLKRKRFTTFSSSLNVQNF